jgi:hypothetical protein
VDPGPVLAPTLPASAPEPSHRAWGFRGMGNHHASADKKTRLANLLVSKMCEGGQYTPDSGVARQVTARLSNLPMFTLDQMACLMSVSWAEVTRAKFDLDRDIETS